MNEGRKMPKGGRLQRRGLYIQPNSFFTKKKKKSKSKGRLQVVLAGGSDHSLKKAREISPLFHRR